MRTLVIPDVHEKLDTLRALEPKMAEADRVVFLGDFFDTFGQRCAGDVARWLKDNLHNEKFDFLVGNHDCHYFFEHNWFLCSGFTPDTKNTIQNILTVDDIARFHVYTRAGLYLLSHVGFTNDTWHLASPEAEENALLMARRSGFHKMFAPGSARGGWEPVGGPTWLDWRHEFTPVDDQLQIVGHTNNKDVRVNAGSYCIDTALNHVAWIEDMKQVVIERIR